MLSWKNGSKPAAATTEVALAVVLSICALFIAIGIFNNNLSEMSKNSNVNNMPNANNTKTTFDSLNRNYTDSQINIQTTGEQGLDTLRKDANNKAIELLSSADSARENANEIGYLALAIESIVGQPNICVYMKNDSDKFCNEDNIGGYSYMVDLSDSSSITVQEVDYTGQKTHKTIKLNTKSNVNNVMNSRKQKVRKNSEGRSDFSKAEKIGFISDLSGNLENLIQNNVLLMRPHKK